jgi:hypothetical protein
MPGCHALTPREKLRLIEKIQTRRVGMWNRFATNMPTRRVKPSLDCDVHRAA